MEYGLVRTLRLPGFPCTIESDLFGDILLSSDSSAGLLIPKSQFGNTLIARGLRLQSSRQSRQLHKQAFCQVELGRLRTGDLLGASLPFSKSFLE